MKSFQAIFICILMVSLISACAGVVKSEVTVFHNLPDQYDLIKYTFVPFPEQDGKSEYLTIQNYIRQELAKHGYIETTSDEMPDVLIIFYYGIGDGKEKLFSVPIYGRTGVSSITAYDTIRTTGPVGAINSYATYNPTYGVEGFTLLSRTEYNGGLCLRILDSKKSAQEKKPFILYEGNVKSSGSYYQLEKVMPAMIKALFEEFPGESGSTRSEVKPIK